MKRALFTLIAAAFATFASTATADSAVDSHGNTALMAAAAIGDTASVERLLAEGADVNARGRIGNTALIYAAQEGHTSVVEILVKAGARVESRNAYNATARKLALGYGHSEIVEYLKDISVNEQDDLIVADY